MVRNRAGVRLPAGGLRPSSRTSVRSKKRRFPERATPLFEIEGWKIRRHGGAPPQSLFLPASEAAGLLSLAVELAVLPELLSPALELEALPFEAGVLDFFE